jgi:sugar transferase EpsL
MYKTFGKRIFDFFGALVAIIILSPIIIVTSILVRLKLGSPIFFTQQRPGLHGKPFMLLKFRTMTSTKDSEGNLLSDAERLTQFGKFLRSSSLDELPELINVLKGNMSLVGPRPLLMQYLERYTPAQARRHEVRPGITGWAQINGRNALTWEEKFKLDVWYIDNLSIWLDIKILYLTVWRVLAREGISQAGEATMAEFVGNNNAFKQVSSELE